MHTRQVECEPCTDQGIAGIEGQRQIGHRYLPFVPQVISQLLLGHGSAYLARERPPLAPSQLDWCVPF